LGNRLGRELLPQVRTADVLHETSVVCRSIGSWRVPTLYTAKYIHDRRLALLPLAPSTSTWQLRSFERLGNHQLLRLSG